MKWQNETDDARKILEKYVTACNVLQMATISETGSPAVCNLWYSAHFKPDKLYFNSRNTREHSINIRRNPQVAGGIVSIPLSTRLGQAVRGVTFKGTARELGADAVHELEEFYKRWPDSRRMISIQQIAQNEITHAQNETSHRLYEITVDEWVMFDETIFPRQNCVIPGEHG